MATSIRSAVMLRNDGKSKGFKRWTLYLDNSAAVDVEVSEHSDGLSVVVRDPDGNSVLTIQHPGQR
jgi:hypothetical protein